ncbi:unnamed protein product [Calicophoron daubneyi]|uniref:C-type lectin domain-containing protein n=1 Tax=Calicophoron daubneyi TaxID=300641 RepID=A0AAV2U0K8_CALDB
MVYVGLSAIAVPKIGSQVMRPGENWDVSFFRSLSFHFSFRTCRRSKHNSLIKLAGLVEEGEAQILIHNIISSSFVDVEVLDLKSFGTGKPHRNKDVSENALWTDRAFLFPVSSTVFSNCLLVDYSSPLNDGEIVRTHILHKLFWSQLADLNDILNIGHLCALIVQTPKDELSDTDDLMPNDPPNGHGYSLLRTDVDRQHLKVWRGHSAPLLHTHLPIQMRAQKGQVCRVEVEEFQPLLSMVGHLEPKKFDCSFANGDVLYHHEGSPLTNRDHVQVTILFFRNNNSVVQTVDILVDIEDPPHLPYNAQNSSSIQTDIQKKKNHAEQPAVQSRVDVLQPVQVNSLKAISDSISPDVLRIYYDHLNEECRLSYTSPEFLPDTDEASDPLGVDITTNGGLVSPRMGLPLAPGGAIGGMRRWPLFGQVVAFNRTTIPTFDHDCQEALLQGYRYMHRKANSPGTDYIPLRVTIWRRLPDGSRKEHLRQGIFLKVHIANGHLLRQPVARTFRQVNVTHIGGSLSVLPRDSISVAHDAIPGMEYLDVNMTRMQGPLQAQIVNLRDPTRPVTSFRLNDLRRGLVALQLLNYAESLAKVFVITMTVVDPFFQVSEPINLRIATFLQPVFPAPSTETGLNYVTRTPSFQVFSLPLFTYTGAVSLIQKHNIQVVGYIDESMVVYTMQHWPISPISGLFSEGPRRGSLELDGQSAEKLIFGPPHIAAMRLAYIHTGGYEPTVERIPLSITVPSLAEETKMERVKRSIYTSDVPQFPNNYLDYKGHSEQSGRSRIHRRESRRGANRGGRRRRLGNRRRRKRTEPPPEVQLELSIRIVRLYTAVLDGALKPGAMFQLPATSSVCFTAEDLLTPEALRAARNDLINLAFAVKVAPSQGVLVRKHAIRHLVQQHSRQISVHGPSSRSQNVFDEADLAYAEQQEVLEKAQVGLIWLTDLESDEVCYLNRRRDRPTDLVGLKEVGRHDFPTVYMTLEIKPPITAMLMEQMDPNVILRVPETASNVPITSLHLNHGLQWISSATNFLGGNTSADDHHSAEQIVYTLTEPPRFISTSRADNRTGPDGPKPLLSTHEAGRLVSLTAVTASTHVGDMILQPGLSTSLRETKAPCVKHFTQSQIDDGDIVYVPPSEDIGIFDKFVIVQYEVSGPGGAHLPDRSLRILIVAEDNQVPVAKIIRPLEVKRDGELILDSSYLSISDIDTADDHLTLQIDRLPRYGYITATTAPVSQAPVRKTSSNVTINSNASVTQGEKLPIRVFREGYLKYRQSGTNVKTDEFVLSVSDGIRSGPPLTIPLQIKPRVLKDHKWNQLVNNSVLIKENSSVTLHASVFPFLSPDEYGNQPSLKGNEQYFVIVFPTKGNLITSDGQPVSQFTTDDARKERLIYRHGPAEIGLTPAFDVARIWDFHTGRTLSLNFTVIPVNSQPPLLRTNAPIQVKEGGMAAITQYVLYASDPDTDEADIQLQIIHPPRWGHIALVEAASGEMNDSTHRSALLDNQTSSESELKQTLSFTMRQIKLGHVFYVNSLHANGRESVEDVFSIRAHDGAYPSPHTVEVKVAIQPTNDEVPSVRLLKYFSVSAGTRKILTPYLFSVSDRDVPRDKLQIQFTELPTYGNLTVFWQHGEKYTLTKASSPITESYLGMMNLVYIQNMSLLGQLTFHKQPPKSLLGIDKFTVTVSDGVHTVQRHAQILIRQSNLQPPQMHLDPPTSDGIVLEGVAWTRLDAHPGGLILSDPDTSDDDLVITLVEAPKYGVIQRLPRLDSAHGVEVLDLIEDAWDMEESAVGEDEQALEQLAMAGSIGGPKAVKTLAQGDRFTKRQIDTGRIHYVYTGPYEKKYVFDSCVLRLSDGDYDTAPVTLRFRIRNTEGRVGVQSLRYFPSGQFHQLRPLEYESERANEGEALEGSVSNDSVGKSNYPGGEDNLALHQMDDSNPKNGPIVLRTAEACFNHHTFLTDKDLNLGRFNNSLLKDSRFELQSIDVPSNYSVSGTVDTCGSIFNIKYPDTDTRHFLYDDLVRRQIVFSAHNCAQFIDQIIQLSFKVAISGAQRFLSFVLPLRITKRCRQLPQLGQLRALKILPGTDKLLTLECLNATDPDTSPTNLIYVVDEELGGKSIRSLGVLQFADHSPVVSFTQHQINTGQVLFHMNPNQAAHYGDGQISNLYLFDAGDAFNEDRPEVAHDLAQQAVRVLKEFGGSQIHPLIERIQYISGDAEKIVTIKPVNLVVQVHEIIREDQYSHDQLKLLINSAPSSNALETVLPGQIGFRLTAENLYLSDSNAVYRFKQRKNSRWYLFNLRLNRTVAVITQNDLNRRQVVVVWKDKKSGGKKDFSEDQQQWPTTFEELQFDVSRRENPKTKRSYRLRLQWMTIGFDRRRFKVCGERGMLSLTVQRRGNASAVNTTPVDAYVGLTSNTAQADADFSLHSQKLLTFQPGERQKQILVRIHPRINKLVRKRTFFVDLKSPTGAILDVNRRAVVIIRNNKQCKNQTYFSPQQSEILVKRDLGTAAEWIDGTKERMSGDDNGLHLPFYPEGNLHVPPTTLEKPISLTEWLATNDLPDSKALSASYERFLQHIQTDHCLRGWKYHESRCYRAFRTQRVSWYEASKKCEIFGAFLTSITDDEHARWLRDKLHISGPYWIGLHQRRPGAPWVWHNLERAGFTKWEVGFPTHTMWRQSSSLFEQDQDTEEPYGSELSQHIVSTQAGQHQLTFGLSGLPSSEDHPYSRLHPSSGQTQAIQMTKPGPKACAMVTLRDVWRNRVCNRPKKLSFVCMKNPEV